MRRFLFHTAYQFFVLSVLLCGISQSPVQAEPAKSGRKLAFLVGVQRFDHTKLKDLEFPERDVEELAEVLSKSGFTVVLLTTTRGAREQGLTPTIKNIRQQLNVLLEKAGKQDLILVGLAGSGIQPLGSDAVYFCPQDADPTFTAVAGKLPAVPARPETLLSIESLLQSLGESGVGQKLLLMDAGRIDPGVPGEQVKSRVKAAPLPPETAVLMGCAPGQHAFEDKAWGGGHGAFFHQVLVGLRGEAVDADEGGVTWDRLVEHVCRQVPRIVDKQFGTAGARQQPVLISNLSKDLPVLISTAARRRR